MVRLRMVWWPHFGLKAEAFVRQSLSDATGLPPIRAQEARSSDLIYYLGTHNYPWILFWDYETTMKGETCTLHVLWSVRWFIRSPSTLLEQEAQFLEDDRRISWTERRVNGDYDIE